MTKQIKEENIISWKEEIDNFCKCINFGESFLNNQAIQFMNRGFDQKELIDLGRKQTLEEVEKIIEKRKELWEVDKIVDWVTCGAVIIELEELKQKIKQELI